MFTSSKELQIRSFDVVKRTRTSKCQKLKNAGVKRAKILFVGFLLPSSSWLLKLPIAYCETGRLFKANDV